MKKMFLGLFALLIAVATVFAANRQTATTVDPIVYHWFDENGFYIGDATLATQQGVCDGSLPEICMRGYEELDNEGQPTGEPVELFKEQ